MVAASSAIGALLPLAGEAQTAPSGIAGVVKDTSGGVLPAGGARTANVPLIAPQTQFEERRNQLDLQLTKIVRAGARGRVEANFDAYNVLNSSRFLPSTRPTVRSGGGRPPFSMGD